MTTAAPLVALGFTALEADVYELLLEEPAVTGYRIAQRLHRPAPNVYKALESLEEKGAVMVEAGRTRICRPVPPDELLAHLERRFRAARDHARRALARRDPLPSDDRVYQLRSSPAVFERGRAMLTRAREVALIDAFPGPLDRLASTIEETTARGVRAGVKCYAPTSLAAVESVLAVDAERTLERWPAAWLNLVVDGREMLVGLLSEDGSKVHHAIWSANPHLVWSYHSALAAELLLDAIAARLTSGAGGRAALEELDRLSPLRATESPGYHDLLSRLARPGPEEDSQCSPSPS